MLGVDQGRFVPKLGDYQLWQLFPVTALETVSLVLLKECLSLRRLCSTIYLSVYLTNSDTIDEAALTWRWNNLTMALLDCISAAVLNVLQMITHCNIYRKPAQFDHDEPKALKYPALRSLKCTISLSINISATH